MAANGPTRRRTDDKIKHHQLSQELAEKRNKGKAYFLKGNSGERRVKVACKEPNTTDN
jgi:hypothetical protein